MGQFSAIGICPVALTCVAIEESPGGNQCFRKVGIKWQFVLVPIKLEIPLVKPSLISPDMVPNGLGGRLMWIGCLR